jgi:hypothetical protein
MILRLCLNEMVLQSSEHEPSPQRQPDSPRRILVNRRAANLVNMDGPSAPISSIMTRHFIPPPVPPPGRP